MFDYKVSRRVSGGDTVRLFFQQFLKWRDEKYERERREERQDRRYEYEEDKR